MVDQFNFQQEETPAEAAAPTMSQSDVIAWAEIGIFFKDDGEINWSKSLINICRNLSRLGHEQPRALRGKPYGDSWWGPEPIRALDVENYLERFDVQFDHTTLRKVLADLVRRGKLDRQDKNTFIARATNL